MIKAEKDLKTVELRCPGCGGEDIFEWSKIMALQEVIEVVKNTHGNFVVREWGSSEPIREKYETVGFACRDYCEGDYFPLEHYVVKAPD
jgi:hypothetical protein